MAQVPTCPGVGIHRQPSQQPWADYSYSGDHNNPIHVEREKEKAIQDNIDVNMSSKALHPDVPLPAA
eukprot:12897165-Prorocentrum_lima.AAC.1